MNQIHLFVCAFVRVCMCVDVCMDVYVCELDHFIIRGKPLDSSPYLPSRDRKSFNEFYLYFIYIRFPFFTQKFYAMMALQHNVWLLTLKSLWCKLATVECSNADVSRVSPWSEVSLTKLSFRKVSEWREVTKWATSSGISFTSPTSLRIVQGLTYETSALEKLYGGQFKLSTQLIKPNFLVTSFIDTHSFFKIIPSSRPWGGRIRKASVWREATI